jgi:hypothetical protein
MSYSPFSLWERSDSPYRGSKSYPPYGSGVETLSDGDWFPPQPASVSDDSTISESRTPSSFDDSSSLSPPRPSSESNHQYFPPSPVTPQSQLLNPLRHPLDLLGSLHDDSPLSAAARLRWQNQMASHDYPEPFDPIHNPRMPGSEGEGGKGGGSSSAHLDNEEEGLAPVGPRPALSRSQPRRLDLDDKPQHHLALSQPASAVEQASSSATNPSSSPLFGPRDSATSAVMQGSPLSSVELPAADVTAADGGGRPAQHPTTARWVTIPQLRELVTQATGVSRSGQDGMEKPSILLGFHQDYPVHDKSVVSYLVTCESVGVAAHGGPSLTLESHSTAALRSSCPFNIAFMGEVRNASMFQPKPHELHLVDVLFDMARISSALATIVDDIPVMSNPELNNYYRDNIKLIPGQQHPYGRFGEKQIGTGFIVQLHVAVLRAKGGLICPVPPTEPVVFFTVAGSDQHPPDAASIAHPILIQPPLTLNPLYSTATRDRYPYEETPCVTSLTNVSFHHLTTVSNDIAQCHWHTAGHNISSSNSEVMTVFATSKEFSSSITPPSESVPLIYRYLSNDLNTWPSSTPHSPLREQNIMSAVIDTLQSPRQCL